MSSAEVRDAEEYRRLLYVAMTRARDRLYRLRNAETLDRCRHRLARAGRTRARTRLPADRGSDGSLVALEWGAPQTPPRRRQLTQEQYAWLPSRPPGCAVPPRRQCRGAAGDALDRAAPRRRPGLPASAWSRRIRDPRPAGALGRGRIIHRLLQSLAGPSAGATPGRRRRLSLLRPLPDWPEADRTAIARRGHGACLDDPASRRSLLAGSRAEVEIAGRIDFGGPAPRFPAGSTGWRSPTTMFFIVDYKTNRPGARGA